MIRTFIIDDDKFSIVLLKEKLDMFPIINVVKTYTSQEQLLSDIKNERVDVVFLDIEMPGLNGIHLSEEILTIRPTTQIVFVTAYPEYALKAFELNSIDYLLKPVSIDRLTKTIDRLKKNIGIEQDGITGKSHKHLKIQCFNELIVFYNDKIVHFKTAKVRELFAFLLTHHNNYVNRDLIIEQLWPHQEYNKSKIYLHTCFSHLRKTLSEIGYSDCISFSNQNYILSLDYFYCDIVEFRTIIQDLSMIDSTTIIKAERVVQLYTGSYLALNNYDWAYPFALKYEDMFKSFLDNLIIYFEKTDHLKTLYYLQLQLHYNPYLDEAVKKIMIIYANQGNRYEAIKTYKNYKLLLLEDLGIEPKQTLTEVYQSILEC